MFWSVLDQNASLFNLIKFAGRVELCSVWIFCLFLPSLFLMCLTNIWALQQMLLKHAGGNSPQNWFDLLESIYGSYTLHMGSTENKLLCLLPQKNKLFDVFGTQTTLSQ